MNADFLLDWISVTEGNWTLGGLYADADRMIKFLLDLRTREW